MIVTLSLIFLTSLSLLVIADFSQKNKLSSAQINQYQDELATLEAIERARLKIANYSSDKEKFNDILTKEPLTIQTTYSLVKIYVLDVGGLIDVNLADEKLLRRFFLNIGEQRGDQVVDTLIKQRRSHPIKSFAEIRHLFSVENADKIQRWLTTHNGRSNLSTETVHNELLFLLSGKSFREEAINSLPLTWFEEKPIGELKFVASIIENPQ